MKHIGQQLYAIIDKKKLVKRQIAKELDIDPSRFNALMHRESLDAKLLDRICKVIGVSPGYFFDDWPSDKLTIGEITNQTVIGDASISIGDKDIKHLEIALKAKDELIADKERIIKLLSDKAGIDI